MKMKAQPRDGGTLLLFVCPYGRNAAAEEQGLEQYQYSHSLLTTPCPLRVK